MPSAYLNYAMDSACPYHRCLLPARHCSEAFEKKGWTLNVGEGLPPGHDIYIFHGLPAEVAIVEFARLKRRGAKIAWSVDDDWKTIPDWNPAKPPEDGMAMYDMAKMMADWILTSTPYLASTFADVKEKVLCAPNLLDLGQFPEIPFTDEGNGKRNYTFTVEHPIRFVWCGGSTHRKDVEEMSDAIARMLDKYKNKVAFIYQGMSPPHDLLKKFLHRGLFHQPSVPFPSFQKVLNSTRPNVYLAPLAPVEFNLSKSNLRIMEGWALGAAPVASNYGEYACVRNAHDGRLVNDPEEWFQAMSRMATDHEYRLGMVSEGRKRVEEEYSWQNVKCRKPWYELFAKITGVEPEVDCGKNT